MLTRRHGQRRVPLYGCLAYHKRGPSVCGNGLVLPVARVDDAVLRAFAGDALAPAVITLTIDMIFAALQPENVGHNVAALKNDLWQIDQIVASRAAIEARVQAKVATWRELLGTAVVRDGRQLLNEMLEGPLRFTPEGRAYRFVGPVATGRAHCRDGGVSTECGVANGNRDWLPTDFPRDLALGSSSGLTSATAERLQVLADA